MKNDSLCYSGDGISMKCKIKTKTVIFITLGIFAILIGIWIISGQSSYKNLLFFKYSFSDAEAMNKEFQKLGFQYKMNFQECPEKKILLNKIQIQNFSYQNRNCVILFFDSDKWNNKTIKILNKKAEMKKEKIILPDDFYFNKPVDIFLWTLDDRKIYWTDEHKNKIYIEQIDKNYQ